MGIALFLLFSVTHKIGLFSPNRQQHSKNSSIPIFNARDTLGRTPLESARAYASSGRGTPRSSRRALTPRCPPTRRKRRGRGFGRGGGRGGRGPIGRLACACWSAPPPTSLSTVRRRRRVCGGVSLRSGRRTERDKKNRKKRLCLIWPPTGNSNTTTNQKHTHATQAVKVRRFDRQGGGERDLIVGGDQVGRGGIILK